MPIRLAGTAFVPASIRLAGTAFVPASIRLVGDHGAREHQVGGHRSASIRIAVRAMNTG